MLELPARVRTAQESTRYAVPTPNWVRVALVALVLGAATVYGLDASRSGFSDYYATAAKSMSVSWKAFFFGAFDPQSTITIDKLAGFLIPQALSARLFGFSALSLAIPQVLEGLVTIVAAYFIIRRWIGPIGGLIGAMLMASTPLLVSMFSHPMEDGMLTMFSILAIGALQRSIDAHRTRYLLLAGMFIGLGFQAKMMQAWLLLPSLALVYLLVASGPLARKLIQLCAAGLVTLAVSFSWMTAIALVPASSRPFIDGTTNNNIFSMVIGYNGVDRFVSNLFPGALSNDAMPRLTGTAHPVGLVSQALAHNPVKLFLPAYSSQIGWFYPLAALGLFLGILALRKARSEPIDPTAPEPRKLREAVLLNGTLAATLWAVLSVMTLPHTAYLASMAFPLASLSAVGLILAWRHLRGTRSKIRFALPIAVVVQTGWSLILISRFPSFAGWLLAIVAILGGVAATILFGQAMGWDHTRRVGKIVAAVAFSSALLAPATWSVSTLDSAYSGTANDAYAGPPASGSLASLSQSTDIYGIGLDSNRVTPLTSRLEAQAYRYAESHSKAGRFVLATDSWRSAAPLIMNGKTGVRPMGGYSSRVASPSISKFRSLVTDGSVGFVLLSSPDSKSGVSTPTVFAIHTWVMQNCRLVPEADYTSSKNKIDDLLFDCGFR